MKRKKKTNTWATTAPYQASQTPSLQRKRILSWTVPDSHLQKPFLLWGDLSIVLQLLCRFCSQNFRKDRSTSRLWRLLGPCSYFEPSSRVDPNLFQSQLLLAAGLYHCDFRFTTDPTVLMSQQISCATWMAWMLGWGSHHDIPIPT